MANLAKRDREIEELVAKGYTLEEATSIWDWDNSDEETEETKKASENWKEMSRSAHGARTFKEEEKTEEKPKRVRIENPTKKTIISALYEFISDMENSSDTLITNPEKYITFAMNGEKYELNLVQKRKPKAK